MLENAAAILNEAKRNGVSFDGLELNVTYENQVIHYMDADCLIFAPEDESRPSVESVLASLDQHSFCKKCTNSMFVQKIDEETTNQPLHSFVFEIGFLNAAIAFLTEDKFDEETARMYYAVKDPRTEKSEVLKHYYQLFLKAEITSTIFDDEDFKLFKDTTARDIFISHITHNHDHTTSAPSLSSLSASLKQWAETEADELLKSEDVIVGLLDGRTKRQSGTSGQDGLFHRHFFTVNFAVTPIHADSYDNALYCFPKIYLPWVLEDLDFSALMKNEHLALKPQDVPEDLGALFKMYTIHRERGEEGPSLKKALETLKALDK